MRDRFLRESYCYPAAGLLSSEVPVLLYASSQTTELLIEYTTDL